MEHVQKLLAAGRLDDAFNALVDGHQQKVFRLVYSIVNNAARAEEVTQDVFLKVWLALPGYDGRASLSTWIYTIARNTSLTHVRSESYRKTLPMEGDWPGAGPSGAFEIQQLVERLPEEQRAVVRLFYLQERSVEDVAEMLDLPAGTVKSHLHRARKALAEMMGAKK